MKFKYPFFAMGCSCEIVVKDKSQHAAKSAIEIAVREVKRLEAKYSYYSKSSYLSEINREAGEHWVQIDSETQWLFETADRFFIDTDGLFDPTIGILSGLWDFKNMRLPEREEIRNSLESVGWEKCVERDGDKFRFTRPRTKIDLGGIVKEYVADQCRNVLEQIGVKNALINLGGDIIAFAEDVETETAKGWSIGVSNPRDHKSTPMNFSVKNAVVLTSGDYHRYFLRDGKRYHHILSPITGYPLELKFSGVTFLGRGTAVETSLALSAFYYAGKADLETKSIDAYICFDADGVLTKDSRLPENTRLLS